jgi:phosphohistidine phosphatase
LKTLFIIRHSKSSWKNANLSDHERPLNKRGNIDAKLISNYLSSVVINIDFLHCSSSKRTRETAEYFLEKININKQNYDDQLYHVSSEDLLQAIRAYDNNLSSAMIIAHNPGLTNFVNLLTDLNLWNLPTTGMIVIDFNVSSWEEIKENNGKILFKKFPKEFKKE